MQTYDTPIRLFFFEKKTFINRFINGFSRLEIKLKFAIWDSLPFCFGVIDK